MRRFEIANMHYYVTFCPLLPDQIRPFYQEKSEYHGKFECERDLLLSKKKLTRREFLFGLIGKIESKRRKNRLEWITALMRFIYTNI